MTDISIAGDTLVITPKGLDKLWGFQGRIEVPLAHVRGASHDPDVASEPKGIRAPGLATGGKWVGTFRRDGDTSYWNVDDATRNVVIEFCDEPYTRAIITVDDPVAVERRINAALQGR